MIGIVLAVRNQERYVGEALTSIAAQTLAADQVVLVDDASTDGTASIARSHGVTVLPGPGKGPAIARNIGARHLKTKFISFLDGDDRCTPQRNHLLLDAIAEVDAVSGKAREFFDPGRESELAATYAIAGEPISGTISAMLIRRDAFERIGGFTEDPLEHDFFAFMHALGSVPEIDDVVLERRIHGQNHSIVDRDEIRRKYLYSARKAVLAGRAKSAESAEID